MSEELKDEAICIAHSSIKCDERSNRTYEPPRACKLVLTEDDRPYKSHCPFRLVIKAPAPAIEPKKPEPVVLPATESDELPF